MYGWYSVDQAFHAGTVVYSTPDGGEVQVTGVARTKESGEEIYKHWTDRVYVGEVCKYLREGMPSCCPTLEDYLN